MTALYYPDIFNASDVEAAKKVILTDEGLGADTETRWNVETPYVLDLILGFVGISSSSVVLDYGCGVGRLAKALIDATGCFVIGLDVNAKMRALSEGYVASSRFIAVSPEQFDALVRGGLKVDGAISVWVLQHCFNPADDVARVHRAMRSSSRFFVLNMTKRAVPALSENLEGEKAFVWAEDNIDVAETLKAHFQVVEQGTPEQGAVPNMAEAGAYWMSLLPLAP